MVNIILVEKTGELKKGKYVEGKDELYKKCKFKKSDGFELRHTWNVKNSKKNKYSFTSVVLYARDTGKANMENKYDFPPPVDNILYFGCMALVAKDDVNEHIDLSLEDWEKFYEDLFGGFENLDDTTNEDENEVDELVNVPAEMKTKTGYLKDDFVVDDNLVEDVSGSNSGDEGTWDDESTAELEYEDYSYSDED
jgi:hypothetical protein|tara:strand:+ start:2120 stop:2704 length:585 start_codon:yes stop_codon:yes gene_type:complete